jgi:hypothetical protein
MTPIILENSRGCRGDNRGNMRMTLMGVMAASCAVAKADC